MVRYLRDADENSAKMRKFGKYFRKNLDFKDIKLPVRFRDIHKIEKTNSISILSTVQNSQYTFQKYF